MENEDVIRQIFGDTDLLASYDSDTVSRLTVLVISEVFWAKGAVVLQLLEPIHKCLACFEKDTLCLSVLYLQFVELARHPIYTSSTPGVGKRLQAFILERIEFRWNFIYKSAMAMTYLLDHTKSTSNYFGTAKIDTMMEIIQLAGHLGYDEQKRDGLNLELADFLTEKLGWSDEHRAIYYKSSPLQWWTWDGADKYPLLAPIAQRLFVIPTSSAASERSWSIFKFIHSARRNRLKNETVIKLAFIYSNQGSKDPIHRVVYDTVADLLSASTAELSGESLSAASVDPDLLGQIRQLEDLMDHADQHQEEEDE